MTFVHGDGPATADRDDADRSTVRADLADHPALLRVRVLWHSRAAFAQGVLDDIERFAVDPRC